MAKIVNKYYEDRIRHLDEIVDSKEIIINIGVAETSYYIAGDEAVIKLRAKYIDNEINIYPQDEIFLKKVLVEFIKRHGYMRCMPKKFYHTAELYDEYYKNSIVLDDRLYPYVLDANREVYRMNQDCDNITIDDYLLDFKEDKNSPKMKIKN